MLAETGTEQQADAAGSARPRGRHAGAGAISARRADLVVLGSYLVAALVVTSRMWRSPQHRYLAGSAGDQYGFEWIITWAARAVTHLQNPLFTPMMNAPDGVNVMAQTSILGLTIPMTPVTLVFGAPATFVILLTAGLAGTAAAWYWLLSRHVVTSRAAAAIGGALCGFGPPMISHANGGHLNFISLYLLPFIAWWVVRLGEPGKWLRNGAVLGLLVAWQIFVGEEPLLIAALGVATFIVVYALIRRDEAMARWRPFLAGLGVAAVVALALAGYALWFQFSGPQSYGAIPHAVSVSNDVFALTTFASQSLGGLHPVGALAYNPTEENGFLGWPLLALTVVAAVWLWRSPKPALARAAAITAGIFLVLSLGLQITVGGKHTGIPGPWRLFAHLPLVGSILPSRLTFAAIPAMALVLALATDRVVATASTVERGGFPARLLWFGALIAVLLPIVPSRMDIVGRPDAPAFFAAGTWRDYVTPGHSVVVVPAPHGSNNVSSRWQVVSDLDWAVVEGYFIGPWGEDRHGWYGVEEHQPTMALLESVRVAGKPTVVSAPQKAAAAADVRHWNADAVVLSPGVASAAALKSTLDGLYGPGQLIGGLWVWDVRSLNHD